MSTAVSLKLKSERIQLPGAWEFSPDNTSASARFEFGSRRGAVAFVGLASELAEREELKVGFLVTDGSAVRVTLEAETDGTFSDRDLDLLAAFNRLVGEETAP